VDEADQGVSDAPAGGPEQPYAKGVPRRRRLVRELGRDAPRVGPREFPRMVSSPEESASPSASRACRAMAVPEAKASR
jgi:hypothetical protein